MGGSPAPRTEADLLATLPPSNTPGLLPRELLPPGETVLYETRPSAAALYWGRLTFLGLYLALFIGLGATSLSALPGSLFFIALGVIWLLLIYFGWRGQVYALTDQRVIRTSGVRGTTFQDAAYSQITNMTLEPGYGGGLKFDTTPPSSPYGASARVRSRPLRWNGVPDGPRVYSFVQEAFAIGIRRAHQRAATDAVLSQLSQHTVPCAYCGTLIDLDQVDRDKPRCPGCGAPLTLP